MPTLPEIVSAMRNSLAVTEPELDTTVGSTVRKILDAVGEQITEAYADEYLLNYQYDIDAKRGSDLEDFVSLFGFSRFPATRAVGEVTFERSQAMPEEVFIPMGSQLATNDNPPVVVATTVPAVMPPGEVIITVPVQAVVGGARGNVGPNSIGRAVTPLVGITSMSNLLALSNGGDAESDEALRLRFRRTVFRSLAGTEQMFLGVCLDDPDVTQANVIGAAKRYRETVELVAGAAQSMVPSPKYVFPGSETVGRDIEGGDILVPGVHYTFDSAIPPKVTSIDSAFMPNGIYDLEFEYLPQASRNDPAKGYTNRVDVYVNGTRHVDATETAVFRRLHVFNNTVGDRLERAKFRRLDNSQPVSGNHFVAYAFAPVTDPSIDGRIIINGVIFEENVDYWLVNDVTNNGGTFRSLSGAEFKSAANGQTKALPSVDTPFGINYTYNAIPRDLEIALRSWRLVTTDARVHAAKSLLLNLHFAVIFEPGFSPATVRSEMRDRLSAYIAQVGFTGFVQVSDLLGVAHSVNGVDAVRFLTSNDHATNYAIQVLSPSGTVIRYSTVGTAPARAADLAVPDDSLPILNDVFLTPKSQNSFGVV